MGGIIFGGILTALIAGAFAFCLVRLCKDAKRAKKHPDSIRRQELDHDIITLTVAAVFLLCWIAVIVVAVMILNGAIRLM